MSNTESGKQGDQRAVPSVLKPETVRQISAVQKDSPSSAPSDHVSTESNDAATNTKHDKAPTSLTTATAESSQKSTFQWPPTEEEEAIITQVLYGPSRRKRLPVFVDICPE